MVSQSYSVFRDLLCLGREGEWMVKFRSSDDKDLAPLRRELEENIVVSVSVAAWWFSNIHIWSTVQSGHFSRTWMEWIPTQFYLEGWSGVDCCVSAGPFALFITRMIRSWRRLLQICKNAQLYFFFFFLASNMFVKSDWKINQFNYTAGQQALCHLQLAVK